jgi:hypothetical protein
MSWENIVKNQYNNVLSDKILAMAQKSSELSKLMSDLMDYVSKNNDVNLLEMITVAAKESSESDKTMLKIIQYISKREGDR